MSRVVHFEIHASQPQTLMDCYASLFGGSFTKWEGPADYWLIETGPSDQPGVNGGFLPRRGTAPLTEMPPVNAFVCTVEIPSLEKALSQSIALGAKSCFPRCPFQGSADWRTSRIPMAICSGSCSRISRRLSQP